MKRRVRSWIKQNPVAVFCLVAIVSIVCDTVVAFQLPSGLTTALTNIGHDVFWLLNTAKWLFLVAYFFLESERAKRFLFNRSLGFYDCSAALFLAIAAHDLRHFSENHHAWNWDLGFDLVWIGLFWICGLVRGGDADWVQPEENNAIGQRPMFGAGLSDGPA